MVGPHPGIGGPHLQFGYHGHFFNPVDVSPFIILRAGRIGRGRLARCCRRSPPGPQYYYPDWATLNVDPPPPVAQWVRYGPDLLLVDIGTGNVIEVVPGVFYE
jgi:hypothetical protein